MTTKIAKVHPKQKQNKQQQQQNKNLFAAAKKT